MVMIGWQSVFNNNLIIQYGTTAVYSTNVQISYPIAFSTIAIVIAGDVGAACICYACADRLSYFILYDPKPDGRAHGFYWIAIGY